MFKWTILLALCFSTGCPAKTRVVTLSKQAQGQQAASGQIHSISPYIYGFGTYLREDRAQELIWELNPTIYRWGGNTSSRYNYKVNSWNSANDWYFHNYSGGQTSIIDRFMSENREKGVSSMITIPMMGWVAKDGSSFSFPKSKYPKQDAFDGEAGNGVSDGKKLKADPLTTSVKVSPEFVAGWVKKLKTQFGKHPHFYIMDNEPMLWNSTHRDVHPEPTTYDSYLKTFVEFAAAVREADPEAVIVGPALWGWLAMQSSAYDIEGPWSGGKKNLDKAAHGNKPFFEWFLEQIAKEERLRKVSLLDVIDVHFYPETGNWPGGDASNDSVRKQLLKSTRSLWDRTYTDESWINEKLYFIPRLKEMAAKFKPAAKVSIGEYNFRSEKDASGAIAQADILGIMGREDLYAAQYWDFPIKDGTHRNAFLLYRNFDGKGAAFGDRYLPNSAGNQDDHSVYTAEDSSKKRLTVILLNKSTSDDQEFDLQLASYGKVRSARVVGWNAIKSGAGMERYETKLPLQPTIKIKTRPLSMQIVEMIY
jgi:hypothetical protein